MRTELTRQQKDALIILLSHKSKLTRQEYKVFKEQIYSGDITGFNKGLEKIVRRQSND